MFVMRIFLTVLTLIIGLQSLTKADDIRDFAIEDISIGDSLLNYYSQKELNNAIEIFYYPGGNDYIYYFLKSKNKKVYQFIQVHVSPNDKNFTVEGIEGHIMYKKISKCHAKMNEIKNSLDKVFNVKNREDFGKHPIDKTGKSTFKRYYYLFSNNDSAEITCNDMSKKLEKEGKKDRLVVSLSSKKLKNFLTYEAY